MINDATTQWRIRENETYRNSLISWLAANGIDSKNVPLDVRPTFVDGRMTIQLYERNENGALQFDPMEPNAAVRRTVTMDLAVPPTYDVELWATPPCPTCGR